MTLILIGSLVLSLVGCGADNAGKTGTESAQIELIDPVNAEVSFEEVMSRTLYDASIYAATVVPYVEEYSAEYAFGFGSYGAYFGEAVSASQEIIKANTDSIDEQIKAKKEYIISMQEEYDEYVEKQTEALQEQRELEGRFQREMQKNEAQKPPQFITNEEEEEVTNPEYEQWLYQYEFNTGCYRIAKNDGDIIEHEMEKKRTLFEMDMKHEKYLLKSLQNSRSRTTVTTNMSGEIVALRWFDEDNTYVPAETAVVAVGDMSQKLLRCEYVNKNTIKNAKEVYAVIDGQRYDVEYHAISSDEYARLSANGGKVYSTFTLLGAGDEVNIGDYAVITIISKQFDNVLSVPKGAIKKDDAGSYVYVYENGKNVYKQISTGFSDGIYTEVITGLNLGDKVLYDAATTVSAENTMKLTKGSYSTEFSGRAQLIYPSTESLTNPVEYGTVYFGEYLVERYQHVNKGDVVATIRVEPDNLTLRRNETRLTRLRERLADYKERNKDHADEEYYKTAVENYEEQIKDITEIINDMKSAFATKKIVAEKTGIIISMQDFKAESIVQKGAWIMQIADENTCYVEVEDTNQILQYGNEVQVVYTVGDRNNQQERSVTGKVVSMSRMGVSADLQTDNTEVLLPKEEIANMLEGMTMWDFWNRYRYEVRAKTRNMDNVVIVPRTAVYDYGGGKTYVYVKDENGNAKAQAFVSGGHNDTYYWVIAGLTEGMEICLK
ncbi:MAG: HlyD family efflux transporter periplasmic adaptor subunit [Lachnospiraceae bacterium]|nr:HlyD family efflux transporter periplasmic adaptor subunit [Lachnospiraceae bacterium]